MLSVFEIRGFFLLEKLVNLVEKKRDVLYERDGFLYEKLLEKDRAGDGLGKEYFAGRLAENRKALLLYETLLSVLRLAETRWASSLNGPVTFSKNLGLVHAI